MYKKEIIMDFSISVVFVVALLTILAACIGIEQSEIPGALKPKISQSPTFIVPAAETQTTISTNTQSPTADPSLTRTPAVIYSHFKNGFCC